MKVTNFKSVVWSAVLMAALLAAPVVAAAQDAEASPVTCKDGTTSKGGRGACSGHGGVDKSAGATSSASSACRAGRRSFHGCDDFRLQCGRRTGDLQGRHDLRRGARVPAAVTAA